MNKNEIISHLERFQSQLCEHPCYKELNSPVNLQTFMESHVYAVWDFMSLLKSLQNYFTTTSVPWRPSPLSGQSSRFINEIVVAEESDTLPDGRVMSHFEMYLLAMEEVGADTSKIKSVISSGSLEQLPKYVQEFVSFHLSLAVSGSAHEVAAAFFYGREKLIPEMFTSLLRDLEESKTECPYLKYYLERHIELDGDEHGPLAEACLEDLCGSDDKKWNEALHAGLHSLILRKKLWDGVLESINQSRVESVGHQI